MDFKLRVPSYSTTHSAATIRVVTTAGGTVTVLDVTPESRRKDIVVLGLQ